MDYKCNKVIILVDRNNDSPKILQNKFKGILRKLSNENMQERVFFCIINRKIESWLLTAIPTCSKNPENEDYPEKRLSECLGRKYIKGYRRTVSQLAAQLDLEELKEKCPSSKCFFDAIRDPK